MAGHRALVAIVKAAPRFIADPEYLFRTGDPRRAGRGAGGMTTWAVWFVAAMIMFACIEGFALFTRRIPTLSATIWQLTKRQPLLPFAIGFVIGALAVHFWGRVGAHLKTEQS